jgi:hypothetical protein
MLIKQRHSVTLAKNGVEAVDCFKKESFDIILNLLTIPLEYVPIGFSRFRSSPEKAISLFTCCPGAFLISW